MQSGCLNEYNVISKYKDVRLVSMLNLFICPQERSPTNAPSVRMLPLIAVLYSDTLEHILRRSHTTASTALTAGNTHIPVGVHCLKAAG